MKLINDEALIKSCIAGEDKAWSIFIDRFSLLIRWAIKNKVSRTGLSINDDDIDDILQQVLVDIWQDNRLKELKNINALSSWLVVVAQNATADFIRKDARGSFVPAGKEIEDEVYSLANDPRTEAESEQLYKIVEEFIELLPLRERRIMSLELFYDLKHREIANIMGIPINTVSTIIARIKHDIKEKLAKRGYSV